MEQQIIYALKEQYTRDLRKQVVKAILKAEKSNDKEDLKSSCNIINQIFSYIISQLDWNMSKESDAWDDTPLKILTEVFPKIETTKWFKDLQLHATKSIKLEGDFD